MIVSEFIAEINDNYSIETLLRIKEILENNIMDEKNDRNKKLLAEIYYLLAREYKKLGNFEKAKMFASKSKKLYKELNINTIERAEPILWRYLPDIMHEGVVDLLIKELRIKSN